MRVYIYLLAIVTMLLSGCVSGTAHITVNQDRSADMNVRFGAQQQAKKYLGDVDPFVFLQSVLKNNGFHVKRYDEAKEFGVTASRRYESIEEFRTKDAEPASGSGANDIVSFSYQTKEELFFTVYHVKSTVDFSGIYEDVLRTAGKQLGSSLAMAQFAVNELQEQLNLQLKLTLPLKPQTSNAAKTADGGKTLIWHIKPVEKNTLMLTVKIPKLRNILIAGGIALAVCIALLVLWLLHRRKHKKRKE